GCTHVSATTDPAPACSAVVTYTLPTATDNCDATVTVSCLPASGGSDNEARLEFRCMVSDSSGNIGTCSFTVTVTDNDAPLLAGCTNVSATTDPATACSAVVTYTLPTATDNCDATVTVSCLPASGSTFNKGTTTVNCSATDSS